MPLGQPPRRTLGDGLVGSAPDRARRGVVELSGRDVGKKAGLSAVDEDQRSEIGRLSRKASRDAVAEVEHGWGGVRRNGGAWNRQRERGDACDEGERSGMNHVWFSNQGR